MLQLLSHALYRAGALQLEKPVRHGEDPAQPPPPKIMFDKSLVSGTYKETLSAEQSNF